MLALIHSLCFCLFCSCWGGEHLFFFSFYFLLLFIVGWNAHSQLLVVVVVVVLIGVFQTSQTRGGDGVTQNSRRLPARKPFQSWENKKRTGKNILSFCPSFVYSTSTHVSVCFQMVAASITLSRFRHGDQKRSNKN